MAAAEGTRNPPKRSPCPASSEIKDDILSPGFRSAAAMAGWDEETLLFATLIVDDTPVRESRQKRRPNSQQFRSPPTTNPTRKRRSLRRNPDPIPPVVLRLDDDTEDDADKSAAKKDIKKRGDKKDGADSAEKKKDRGDSAEKKDGGDSAEKKKKDGGDSAEKKASGKGLACMDRLREELSCAICLDICFEPTTTPCGHSFCKKCLKCAASKCGNRCPKCRQMISNGRACTVNTVLWNTIQLLFPEEVVERKKAVAANSRHSETRNQTPPESSSSRRSRHVQRALDQHRIRRRAVASQSEDAALALRLQREEFMGAFQDSSGQQRNNTLANYQSIAARSSYTRRSRHI